jgi:hypothetical protein
MIRKQWIQGIRRNLDHTNLGMPKSRPKWFIGIDGSAEHLDRPTDEFRRVINRDTVV